MNKEKRSSINYIFALCLSIFVAILMVLFPRESLTASKYGIDLWFNNVLPALLPFFVCTKVMTRLGVSKIIGRFLEPIMRPIFRVPGEASFIFAVSITSGYPIGIKLISEMRQKQTITRNEAERMLSFCSTSGPLFILGAVGVGMFGNTALGWSIAFSHFCGALLNGFIFRFYGKSKSFYQDRNSFSEVFKEARRNSRSSQPFIVFLGEAILDSFKTLLLICGYIILFSILVTLLGKMSFFHFFSHLDFFNVNHKVLSAYLKGFFEMTIGCSAASQISNISFVSTSILCSAIVSWGGLSTLAQALTFISQTDINGALYTFSKFSHALCAMLCALVFAPLMVKYQTVAFSAFNISNKVINSSFIYKLLFSTKLMVAVILLFVLTAIISHLKSIKK